MSVQQIVDVMTSDQHPVIDASLSDLVALYVNRLARVSGKLSQEEMVDFLGIGVALAQKGLKESGIAPADMQSMPQDKPQA